MVTANTFHDFARTLQGVVRATFGPGALGRLGTVAIAAMVLLCVLGLAFVVVRPDFALLMAAAILIVVVLFIVRGFAYADRYPQFAAMDGAQITRVMTKDVGIKSLPGAPIIDLDAPLIENPELTEIDEAGRV
jgi:hypothetical protein